MPQPSSNPLKFRFSGWSVIMINELSRICACLWIKQLGFFFEHALSKQTMLTIIIGDWQLMALLLWPLFHRCVKNCVMLQRGPQLPSTNNSAGAKEPLKPGEQATSLLCFSPSPPPTHMCVCEKVKYTLTRTENFYILGFRNSSYNMQKTPSGYKYSHTFIFCHIFDYLFFSPAAASTLKFIKIQDSKTSL